MCANFHSKYRVLGRIGEGSFSEVLKVQQRTTGSFLAAKRLKMTYENRKHVDEIPEVMAFKQVGHHANILHMLDLHYEPLSGKVSLIFELMERNLYDLIKARRKITVGQDPSRRYFPEKRVASITFQLLKALDHLHKCGLFHRDVKPENILVKKDVIKLGDLGSVRGVMSKPPYTEYISTRWYRSPECLLTSGNYTSKMDIWATGCVLFEILAMKPLFPGSCEVDTINRIHKVFGTPSSRLMARMSKCRGRNTDWTLPQKSGQGLHHRLCHVSPQSKDLLHLLLTYDPESRPSARRALGHPFLKEARLESQNKNGPLDWSTSVKKKAIPILRGANMIQTQALVPFHPGKLPHGKAKMLPLRAPRGSNSIAVVHNTVVKQSIQQIPIPPAPRKCPELGAGLPPIQGKSGLKSMPKARKINPKQIRLPPMPNETKLPVRLPQRGGPQHEESKRPSLPLHPNLNRRVGMSLPPAPPPPPPSLTLRKIAKGPKNKKYT